jgi:hypothetical protein
LLPDDDGEQAGRFLIHLPYSKAQHQRAIRFYPLLGVIYADKKTIAVFTCAFKRR